MAFHAARRRCRPRRGHPPGHRRRGARLAELARADRGRGAAGARPRSCSRRRPTAARSRPSARASRCTTCACVGRAAHAGLEPERGVNATVELAHQVLAGRALGDAGAGHHRDADRRRAPARRPTPCRPTASFAVDVRVRTRRRAGPGRRRDARAAPGAARCRGSRSTGGPEPAAAGGRGVGGAVRAGRARSPHDLGLPEPTAAAVGGASDGNFTAGVGTPTLDGLGAVGGGAHADDEHVLVDELPGRTALLRGAGRGPAGAADERPAATGAADHDEPDELSSMDAVTDVTAADAAPTLDRAVQAADAAALAPGSRSASSPTSPSWTRSSALSPRSGAASDNPPVTLELLRAFTKAGNYVGGAFDGDRLVGACVGFFHAPAEDALHSHIAGRRAGGDAAAASASRSSCTSAPGRCCAASPRSPGPSTRWSAATPTSTWSSSAARPVEYLPNFYGRDARQHQRRRRHRPAAGALAAARPRGGRGLRRATASPARPPTSSPPARWSRSASAPTARPVPGRLDGATVAGRRTPRHRGAARDRPGAGRSAGGPRVREVLDRAGRRRRPDRRLRPRRLVRRAEGRG